MAFHPDKETITGVIASVLTASALLPQLIKVARTKKSNDISYIMLAVIIAGDSGWVYYGILKNDWIIIIANIVSLLLTIVTAILSMIYKK
jgi:MtN3 and saliva related transmembrane protein